jgi:hypothetical protein
MVTYTKVSMILACPSEHLDVSGTVRMKATRLLIQVSKLQIHTCSYGPTARPNIQISSTPLAVRYLEVKLTHASHLTVSSLGNDNINLEIYESPTNSAFP